MAHGRRLRTVEEAKERRRLQTRLAQRRYRGKKRSNEAAKWNDQSEKSADIRTVASLDVILGSTATTQSASSPSLQTSCQDGHSVPQAMAGNTFRDITKDYCETPDFDFLVTSPSSAATTNVESDTSTSLSSSSSVSSPEGILSTIVIAAERDGYEGMALAKHNKANLWDFLIGDLSAQINSQMLKQGDRVFIPKLDFYRAFFANTFALSFIPSDVQKCRMQSRIAQVWENRSPLLPVPENMVPVQEQFTINHNIVIDVLPWPSVRQKALKAIEAGVLDMDTFKKDAFFGCKEDTNLQASFQVHGASADDDYYFNSTGAAELTMDPESWQCSRSWLEKYWFLVDDKIVRRTNWWRRMQGLDPVKIPIVSGSNNSSRLVEMVR